MRGVRQQDLLRAAKQQVGVGKPRGGPRQAASRSSASTRPPTPGSRTAASILRLLKLAVFSVDQPIREVHFEGADHRRGRGQAPSYVTASNATVKKLTRQFLGVEETRGPARRAASPRTARSASARASAAAATAAWRRRPARARTRRSRRSSRAPAASCRSTTPRCGVKGSLFAGPPRYYKIETRSGKRHKSYRMVIKRGMRRRVLRHPGHHLEGPADPRRASPRSARSASARSSCTTTATALRLVAWRTPKARLLGLQHPAPDAHRAPDAGHRPLDAAAVGRNR